MSETSEYPYTAGECERMLETIVKQEEEIIRLKEKLAKANEEDENEEPEEEKILDVFHYHEVIDRLYLIGYIGEHFLMEHPVVKAHDDVKIKLENALKELAELYQMVGAIEFKKFDNENNNR